MNLNLLRIAFADDDKDDHLLFSAAVRSRYISPIIDCFFNAQDLLDFYVRDRHIAPHIFFLDKNMPGNIYYECLNRLKSVPQLAGIPIVIYSTSDNSVEKEEALAQGAKAFITKPISFPETIQILASAIEMFSGLRFHEKKLNEGPVLKN